MADTKCLDINKPFKRVGQFAPFENEIFESENAAKIYATSGKFGGTAIPGLLVKVLDSSTRSYKVYTITQDYTLRLVSSDSDGSANNEYVIEHICGHYDTIEIPAGTVITSINLYILEAFNSSEPFTIDIVPYDAPANIKHIIRTDDNLSNDYMYECSATDADDEFTYKTHIVIDSTSVVRINGNIDTAQLGTETPTGKLKLVLN